MSLLNKTVLGELTLGEVCSLVDKDTYAIEIGGMTTTWFSFPSLTEDGQLCVMENEYDSEPYIFMDSQKVKPIDGGIEIKMPEGKVKMRFIRAETIDVMERIKCQSSL